MSMEFTSLAAFAAHLGGMVAEMGHLEHEGLEEAAQVVEEEAKAEIGTYQGAAGPFAAWASLKPETIARKANGDTPLLETGAMRDSIERTVIGLTAYVGSNSEIAVYQELGTRAIPPRSFLGGALVRKEKDVVALIASPVASLVAGEKVIASALLP